MNCKLLLLSLLMAPALMADVSLDISIKTENSNGAISKTILMPQDGAAEFIQDDIFVSVHAVPVKDLDLTSGDFAFEMDLRKNGQLISEPTFCVTWGKKAKLCFTETDENGKTRENLVIAVVASQVKK